MLLPRSARGWLLGALVPVGVGEVRFGYSVYDVENPGPAADPRSRKIALGYVHNLSKRIAIYTSVAQVRNSGGGSTTLGGAVAGGPDRSSSGFDVGVRHAF